MESSRLNERKKKTIEHFTPKNQERYEKKEQKLDRTRKEVPGQSGLDNASRWPTLHWDQCNKEKKTIDGEDLEDVKTFTYLGSITDEHGGSDTDESADRKSKSSIFTTEEHLGLKTTVNQQQGQDFQYKCQHSSTVWNRNLENYGIHHPEDTCVY
ncbi:unnamed protein product [Schistosoma margrebowiei]|uniref:Uncharacterized protein n=1 Tax=Schistosoma margrebowiei TaxID=48269 RepID=A0A183MYJ0_9TREM|nr:unnamed protein product [Schistosoma margrebowiei]